MVLPCSTLNDVNIYYRQDHLLRAWQELGRDFQPSQSLLPKLKTILADPEGNCLTMTQRRLMLGVGGRGGGWGFLPGLYTFHMAPEHLLMLESTDVNRKAKEVE